MPRSWRVAPVLTTAAAAVGVAGMWRRRSRSRLPQAALRLGMVGGRPMLLAAGPEWHAVCVGRPRLAKWAAEADRG